MSLNPWKHDTNEFILYTIYIYILCIKHCFVQILYFLFYQLINKNKIHSLYRQVRIQMGIFIIFLGFHIPQLCDKKYIVRYICFLINIESQLLFSSFKKIPPTSATTVDKLYLNKLTSVEFSRKWYSYVNRRQLAGRYVVEHIEE